MTDFAMTSDIVRETEKAVCVDYARERMVWVPKSILVEKDGILFCPMWFAKKNAVGCYNKSFARV